LPRCRPPADSLKSKNGRYAQVCHNLNHWVDLEAVDPGYAVQQMPLNLML